jgi:hypothetical protein
MYHPQQAVPLAVVPGTMADLMGFIASRGGNMGSLETVGYRPPSGIVTVRAGNMGSIKIVGYQPPPGTVILRVDNMGNLEIVGYQPPPGPAPAFNQYNQQGPAMNPAFARLNSFVGPQRQQYGNFGPPPQGQMAPPLQPQWQNENQQYPAQNPRFQQQQFNEAPSWPLQPICEDEVASLAKEAGTQELLNSLGKDVAR